MFGIDWNKIEEHNGLCKTLNEKSKGMENKTKKKKEMNIIERMGAK